MVNSKYGNNNKGATEITIAKPINKPYHAHTKAPIQMSQASVTTYL